MCTVSPDIVVVYTDTGLSALPPIELSELEVDHLVVPEIIFADSFKEEYIQGLSALALKYHAGR